MAALALTAWLVLLAYLFFAVRARRDSGGGTSWDSSGEPSDGHGQDASSSDGGGGDGGGGDGCD